MKMGLAVYNKMFLDGHGQSETKKKLKPYMLIH